MDPTGVFILALGAIAFWSMANPTPKQPPRKKEEELGAALVKIVDYIKEPKK